ncbi:LOW QUALITY PROTEIN: Cationic amino acid transporter 3, partial [Galemys pyrenaicus]
SYLSHLLKSSRRCVRLENLVRNWCAGDPWSQCRSDGLGCRQPPGTGEGLARWLRRKLHPRKSSDLGPRSVFCDLCYTEFGARIPCSFLRISTVASQWTTLRWNLIIFYVFGAAYVARPWSPSFDNLIGNRISQVLEGSFSLYLPQPLAKYPDFFALGCCSLEYWFLEIRISCGYQSLHRTTHRSYLDPIAPIVWVLWALEGLCLLALIGFSVLQPLQEEKDHNPQLLSVMILLFLCLSAYPRQLMAPYHQIQLHSPLLQDFLNAGQGPAEYAVIVGTLCALLSNFLGAVFPMPVVIHAMADVSGILMAFLFKLSKLVDLMSIGNLLTP